jgi:uncharacterized RDD family membrane protein YckC
MSTGLWVYDGANGSSEPVTVEEIARLLSEGVITSDTLIRPSDVISWAPVLTWLPQLAPPAPPEPPKIPPVKGAWVDTKPHPWRRYFARAIDVVVVGGLTWAVIGIVFGLVNPAGAMAFFALFDGPGGRILDLILTLLATVPGTALMVGLTGLSVGKWLFGVKVVRRDGRPIGVLAGVMRELNVFFAGFGAGVPFVSLFTLINSFRRLTSDGHAAWDEPKRVVVLHRPMNALQVVLMCLAIPFLIAARIGFYMLSHAS